MLKNLLKEKKGNYKSVQKQSSKNKKNSLSNVKIKEKKYSYEKIFTKEYINDLKNSFENFENEFSLYPKSSYNLHKAGNYGEINELILKNTQKVKKIVYYGSISEKLDLVLVPEERNAIIK